ncbi:MAG: hypothetical protein ABI835_02840 [Chloroflexota bacterium]
MASTLRLGFSISIPEQNDLAVVMTSMKDRPGVANIEGELNRSAVLQLLIQDRKALLQRQPSPVEGLSMWQYYKQQTKLPWLNKAEYQSEQLVPAP